MFLWIKCLWKMIFIELITLVLLLVTFLFSYTSYT